MGTELEELDTITISMCDDFVTNELCVACDCGWKHKFKKVEIICDPELIKKTIRKHINEEHK